MKYENLSFIDFGAGTGKSFGFATSCSPGNGLALDVQESAVAACREKNIPAEVADILTFDHRSVAQATFAISVFQELSGRNAFRTALINMLRAANSFTVVQHNYYDADSELARKGLYLPGNFDKRTVFKPTLADYVDFLNTHKQALAISGMAVFAHGTVTPEAYDLEGSFHSEAPLEDHPRSLRVVFGRKQVNRFRPGMVRAQKGDVIFLWENAEKEDKTEE